MTSPDSNGREYPKHPLVGVGAIVIRGGKVLLVQRGNEPSKGLWSIPGGLVEIGEDVRDAVRREVREETGISVEPGKLFDVVDAITRDSKGNVQFHYVIVDFLAECEDAKPRSGSDVQGAAWFRMDDLPEMTASAARVVRKAARGRPR